MVDERPRRRPPALRPDLPGGRGRKRLATEEDEPASAMAGRGDDRRHKPARGETGRKKRKRGDQGAWN